MSRTGAVASKTVFDALAVESGEESDEDAVVVSSPERAQKLARTEKRQQQKALAKAQREQVPEVIAPSDAAPLSSVVTTVLSETPVASEHLLEPVPPEPPISDPPALNGIASAAAVPTLSTPQPECNTTVEKANDETVIQPLEDRRETPRETVVPLDVPAMQPETSQEIEKAIKRQSFITRTLWTFIMIGGFLCLLLLGHAYMILLVMLCQALVYREVTALFSLKTTKSESDVEAIRGKDPWSKTLNWYFFAVTNYFLYGESIIYYFKHVVFVDAQLLPFATNHRMISFILYTIGFMGFVMSLKKGYLKQQFGLFCWVHMSLLLIVVSSHFIINNILEGLIWFWVPASLVICNDVFAYVWGITLGRTPLFKLSPKKTVEGFVGAIWTTLIFGVVWGTYFMQFDYMICPVHDLGVSAWNSTQCTPNPVFVWKEWVIWKPVSMFLSTLFGRAITTIPYAPYQYHLLLLSFFASLVAPFGGFFASGFKRAFDIKDFGHSIPGHGGMTDRMDCQFLMGVFTYVYYSSLIRQHNATVGGILQTIVSGLTLEQQLELIADLKKYLGTQGIQVP
ncbi:hypothetical protein H0H92_006961 [Tricholoma furcatifolium]|nr:hypothetical protein H0H92_006961 [Tricholoma furcatifolium]